MLDWVKIGSIVLGALVGALGMLIPYVKSVRGKKVLNALNDASVKVLGILDMLPKFIQAAEHTATDGQSKKAYVMKAVTQMAAALGVNISSDDISDKIDELVNLTKYVNIGGKKDDPAGGEEVRRADGNAETVGDGEGVPDEGSGGARDQTEGSGGLVSQVLPAGDGGEPESGEPDGDRAGDTRTDKIFI